MPRFDADCAHPDNFGCSRRCALYLIIKYNCIQGTDEGQLGGYQTHIQTRCRTLGTWSCRYLLGTLGKPGQAYACPCQHPPYLSAVLQLPPPTPLFFCCCTSLTARRCLFPAQQLLQPALRGLQHVLGPLTRAAAGSTAGSLCSGLGARPDRRSLCEPLVGESGVTTHFRSSLQAPATTLHKGQNVSIPYMCRGCLHMLAGCMPALVRSLLDGHHTPEFVAGANHHSAQGSGLSIPYTCGAAAGTSAIRVAHQACWLHMPVLVLTT
jgi:hypothetical protein